MPLPAPRLPAPVDYRQLGVDLSDPLHNPRELPFWIPYGFDGRTNKFIGYDGPRHVVTFGPTRSGKGATVLVQSLLTLPHSMVVIDPKGQNAAITARRRREMGQDVFILNPFNELGLGSNRFNPLAHMRIDDPNVFAEVSNLSAALISTEETKEAHWPKSARMLLTALILHLIYQKGGDATLPEVRRLLTLPDVKGTGRDTFGRLIFDMVQSPYEPVRDHIGRFLKDTDEISSVISNANTETAFLADPAIADMLSGNDFTMDRLRTKPGTVYLILPARHMDAYSGFLRAIVGTSLQRLLARPDGYPTIFLLDEFASLGYMPSVASAMAYSAGYNLQIWPILQTLEQLKTYYPRSWETFIGQAGVVQFFTPNDLSTAEYIERRGGTQWVQFVSHTINEISVKQARDGFTGVTRNASWQKEPLLPPELTMSMSENGQIIFLSGSHDTALCHRWPYWRIGRLQGLYDPDPFHSSPRQNLLPGR